MSNPLYHLLHTQGVGCVAAAAGLSTWVLIEARRGARPLRLGELEQLLDAYPELDRDEVLAELARYRAQYDPSAVEKARGRVTLDELAALKETK